MVDGPLAGNPEHPPTKDNATNETTQSLVIQPSERHEDLPSNARALKEQMPLKRFAVC